MRNNKLKMNADDHAIYQRITDTYWTDNQLNSFSARSREESDGFPLVNDKEVGNRSVKMPTRGEVWEIGDSQREKFGWIEISTLRDILRDFARLARH